MTFCGQCGLQLAPSETRCPRCGTLVEPDIHTTNVTRPPEAYDANAPTTQSPSLFTHQSQPAPGPFVQQSQQKLVLPSMPNNTYNQNYATQSAYDATVRQQGAPMVNSYPGYPPQSGSTYTPPGNSHAGYTQPPASFQQGSGQYQHQQYPVQPDASAHTSKGRTTALILILLGLLFILGALVLFILQHNGTLASNHTTSGSTITATAPVTQRARVLIQNYYAHINSRAYREAYQLWKPGTNTQDFTSFKNGFQNTVRDHLTINDTAEQTDGTVKVSVTIDATETTPNAGTQYSTYQGYYIVEPQSDGSVAIINGVLHRA